MVEALLHILECLSREDNGCWRELRDIFELCEGLSHEEVSDTAVEVEVGHFIIQKLIFDLLKGL